MSVASIVCNILYSVYTALKVTFEVIIPTVFQIVKQTMGVIINIFRTINEVWKDISNLAVTMFAQFQKMLVDMFMGLIGNPFERICSNMWNCAALLMELLDGNGLLTRALFRSAELVTGNKMGAFECTRDRYTAAVDYIKNVLNDFVSFQNVVCQFGFTVSFGVDELNNLMKELQSMLNNWTKKKISALNGVISSIEKIERKIGAIGIFDLLQKLSSFGNCVIDNIDVCNEFSTVNNFIANVCSNFNIKQDPATGRFEFDKDFLTVIMKQFNNSNDLCLEIQGLVDDMVSPGGSIDEMFGGINYSKAYDLTHSIANLYRNGISKTWNNICSSVSDAWDNILDNNKLIIDNNTYAMGLYGLDDVTIGEKEIRYYLPYQYRYQDEDSPQVSIRYGIKDITDEMKAIGCPTKYHEAEKMDIPYPDDSVISSIMQSIKDDGIQYYPETAYKTLHQYSMYVNLSNGIESKEKDGKKYIEIKQCRGGVMLFLNCIKDQPFDDNITSDNVTDYLESEGESLGTENIVVDVDKLNDMFKKVVIGDKIVNCGTLAFGMRDFMQGKDTILTDTLGKDNLEKAIETGKKFYGFMNINVGELANRYV